MICRTLISYGTAVLDIVDSKVMERKRVSSSDLVNYNIYERVHEIQAKKEPTCKLPIIFYRPYGL